MAVAQWLSMHCMAMHSDRSNQCPIAEAADRKTFRE